MALSLSRPRIAVPNGGRYPPSRPAESGLSSAASLQAQAAGWFPSHAARTRTPRRSSRPPRTQTHHRGRGLSRQPTRANAQGTFAKRAGQSSTSLRAANHPGKRQSRSFRAFPFLATAKQVAAGVLLISVCAIASSSAALPVLSRPVDRRMCSWNPRNAVERSVQIAGRERSGPG